MAGGEDFAAVVMLDGGSGEDIGTDKEMEEDCALLVGAVLDEDAWSLLVVAGVVDDTSWVLFDTT